MSGLKAGRSEMGRGSGRRGTVGGGMRLRPRIPPGWLRVRWRNMRRFGPCAVVLAVMLGVGAPAFAAGSTLVVVLRVEGAIDRPCSATWRIG